ncbi:MAG TPA: M48 family metallopeptidase, partial [Pirellulaceae bacterium]|nr:M48 family metallopeptidase [Pirellulaceae bacterium]
MAIEVSCSQCNGKFAVAERHAGKLAKCPKCSQQISIPHATATAANLVAEPRAEEVLVATEVAPAAQSAPIANTVATKVAPAKATKQTPAPKQFEDREALASEVLGAFQGSIAPVKTALSYKLGVAAVSLVMLTLPLIYVSLIVLVGYGVYLHLIHDTGLLTASGNGKAKMAAFFIYIAPLFIGGTLIFFMIKPLFAPSGQRRGTRSLTRDGEPLLFAFVDRICDAVGSARPRRIDVDSDVNASASFRNGMLSMFSNDLVLTIGVPLAAGLTMREFAGVLAHEFGHFSQGAGMRLTYLIRTINNWFQRVVYQRDSWDEWLSGTASAVDLRLGAFLYATMFMVWLTRKILWALMMVGHFVSSFLSREMEFDADRYEARLAGGESFESCMRRITFLSVAHQGAENDLREFMREGRLGDNLPKLVIANIEQIPADVKKKIDQHIDTSETNWFDTHPCSKERIASAHREQSAGIFRLEYPASALFAHFEVLSKNVTWDLYRAVFGQTVSLEELHNTDDLVARINKNQQNNQAIERYCQGCFTLLRKLQLPTTAPELSRNPKLTLEALKQYRAKMLAEVD